MMVYQALMAALLLILPVQAAAEEIVINAVGDIMLAGSATAVFSRLGYHYPFAATAAELKKGDITVGNLEAPLAVAGEEFTGKRFRFRAAPQAGEALHQAGFDVLTLANNHIMDFGLGALQETLRNLERNGILYAGAGADLAAARRPALVRVKGKTVAFLAYSLTYPEEFFAGDTRPGTAPGYPRYIREDIRAARGRADHVVVSIHWGAEGASVPKAYQRATGRAAIDAGADLVLGHHPHVLQGIEQYRSGLIVYSLGNFVFGSMSRTSTRSVIARITLEAGVKGVEIIPLNVDNRQVRFQPKPLGKTAGAGTVAHLNLISKDMGTTIGSSGAGFAMDMVPARQGEEYVSLVRGGGPAAGDTAEPGGPGGEPAGGTLGSRGAVAPDVALHR